MATEFNGLWWQIVHMELCDTLVVLSSIFQILNIHPCKVFFLFSHMRLRQGGHWVRAQRLLIFRAHNRRIASPYATSALGRIGDQGAAQFLSRPAPRRRRQYWTSTAYLPVNSSLRCLFEQCKRWLIAISSGKQEGVQLWTASYGIDRCLFETGA
jgi:hypothetical protein